MLIPEWLYGLLITSGLTMIAVLLYLRFEWRIFASVLAETQIMNEQHNRDLILLLDNIYAVLEKISVCGLHWQLRWFGQVIERQIGTVSAYQYDFQLDENEALLNVTLFVKYSGGERGFYFNIVLRHLKALCALDLALKMRQVSSFEQAVARYQLFLAHDLKNFAQMVVLWQQQVQDTPEADALNALMRWQSVAPLIADRASLLAKRLSAPGEIKNQSTSLVPLSLEHLIARIVRWAQVHDVSLGIDYPLPVASVLAEWACLDDAAFQLMRNYQQYANQNEKVLLTVSVDDTAVILSFLHPQVISNDTFRRMQEPLWTSSELGLGLGLWQIGQVLQSMKASFRLVHQDNHAVCFIWQFVRV